MRAEGYGFTTHLREVRSYSKLTGEGVTLIGDEMIHLLEHVLPARFGGSAAGLSVDGAGRRTGFYAPLSHDQPPCGNHRRSGSPRLFARSAEQVISRRRCCPHVLAECQYNSDSTRQTVLEREWQISIPAIAKPYNVAKTRRRTPMEYRFDLTRYLIGGLLAGCANAFHWRSHPRRLAFGDLRIEVPTDVDITDLPRMMAADTLKEMGYTVEPLDFQDNTLSFRRSFRAILISAWWVRQLLPKPFRRVPSSSSFWIAV